MNKLALTLGGLLLIATQVFSQYLSFENGIQEFATEGTSPERTFKNGGAQFCEVTYDFSAANISEQTVNGETYQFLHIDGFAKMGQVGAPALPAHNEIIAMPRNATGNISILESEYYEYSPYMIHPALQPARDTEGSESPAFEKDLSVYNTDSFFPEQIVEITNVGLSRATPLAKVQVRPVQFNPVSGVIRVYTKISYRISFKKGVESFDYIASENTLHYTNLLKLSVLNSESIPDGMVSVPGEPASAGRALAKNYIIITHDQFLTQANQLANWKRKMGYTVEVVSQSGWTAAQVKTAIQTRYDSWTPKPDYFVIIGDHDGSYAVPGEIHQAPDASNFASDLYFACMDGVSDWHPDLARGRISVSTTAEAGVVIDKIINYEKTPPSAASFYSNLLSCAQYQDDDDNDGYADRRFCQTSEDIRDYLQSEYAYTSERVYFLSSTVDVATLRYNNGYYSDGQLLPAELRSTSFNWAGGSSDITSGINAGKFLVFHRDHGYVGGSGWHRPYYTTTSMDALSNGDELPVVFSINCHTGEFQLSNCFAEKFMRMSNKGAVGVIGAAYYSYSGYNDALSEGMIDAIWADPGLFPDFGSGGTGANYTIGTGNEIYTMGDVVNQGLYAMEQNWNGSASSFQYQYELFHWFGDPAMKIWTDNPNNNTISATHATTIDCAGSSFAISGSTAGATATLFYNNELIGKTVLDASGNGTIPYAITVAGTSVDLTISKHNYYSYQSAITIDGTCAFPPVVLTSASTNVGVTAARANGEILNDHGSTVSESGVVYSLNPNPEINGAGVTKLQTSPPVAIGTYSVDINGLNANTTYYVRSYATTENGSGYGDDDVFATAAEVVILPWIEDWEGVTTTTYIADVSGIAGATEWDYDMVDINGRLRFEAGTGFYHGGTKAATLDVGTSGTLNTNFLIAHLDLSNYSDATDLELSLYFMHHGEESHTDDRVWVRGSFADAWIEIYDLYANRGNAGEWNFTAGLDVDAALAAAVPPQTVSNTFQIRIGQRDNYPANTTTSSDGFTFDDIQLTGTQNTTIPVADFSADNLAPAVGSTVYFSDLSANVPTSWDWTFTPATVTYLNGTSSSSQNPELVFDASGLYSAQLIASNALGSDTMLKADYIDVYNCVYPAGQATNCLISNATATTMDISWLRGTGAQVLVVAREENAVNPAPADGTVYTADAVFGLGSEIGTGNFVVYNGVGTSVTITGLNSGKRYFFAVYEYSATSCYLLPALTGSDETLSSTCTYCPSTYTDVADDWITNVTLNTINNSSVQGGVNSYEDFTAVQTDLQIGNSYPVSVSLDMSGAWTEHVWVWIDWNQDCDFDDAGEAFDLGDITGAGTLTVDIPVPVDALLGLTTLRVIEQNNLDPGPCDVHPNNYGETEDYSVNIVAGDLGWIGNSTDWNNPSNWGSNPFVPSPSYNVTIPLAPVGGKFPIINKNKNAACNTLTIEAGATLKVMGNLDVKK